MNTKQFTLLGLFVLTIMVAKAQTSFGDARLQNNDWLFHLGDENASERNFDDHTWQRVTLPHDWGTTQPMSPDAGSCQGYLHGGIGWYRLHFQAEKPAPDRRLYVYFEGVYDRSRVWLNGQLLGYRPSGFASFLYDMTPYLNDGDNVLAVRADHSLENDARWYTGSGINRPVWFVSAPEVHLALWGTAWRVTKLTNAKATVEIDVEATAGGKDYQAIVEVADANGKIVATTKTSIPSAQKQTVTLSVQNPQRWSLTSPYLYKVITRLQRNGQDIDRGEVPMGIRTLTFSPDKGFALNGEWMKVKGVCIHDDAGVLGTAVPADVWRSRLKVLKSLGTNAIRMSHNPHAPIVYDLCDSLGLLVMDEASDEWEFPKRKWLKGWNRGKPGFEGTYDFFEEWIDRDVADMVRRDRCHPSVFMWSIGNEVDYPNDPYSHPVLNGDKDMTQPVYGGYKPEQPNAERIGVIAQRLAKVVRSIDTSRPVTGALAGVVMSNETAYPEAVDVVGYNYTESRYIEDHKKYPKRIIYGSENRHDQAAWDAVTKNEHIFGQFLWTGIDYLGESGTWPARGSEAGLIDLAGFIKPQGWIRARMWDGEIPDSIQNIFSQGMRAMPQSGRPHALRAYLREPMNKIRNGRVAQIIVEVVDDEGRLGWMADNEVTCRIQGRARLLGLENGNIRDTRDMSQPRCRVKNGRLVAYVTTGVNQQPREGRRGNNRREVQLRPGLVRISFSAPFVEPVQLDMEVEEP